nr:C4-type zinc ribbon domain-containing protein [Corynebacterium lactis]
MKISPQQQAAMLETAQERTRIDGLIARSACLPEKAELDRLRANLREESAGAARSRLNASDLGRDIDKLVSDIAKLKAREKADRLSLGAVEDKFERRELQRDMESTRRRRERAERKLEQTEKMRQAYELDAQQGTVAEAASEDIEQATQRLADAEKDIKARIAVAETKFESLRATLDPAAEKLYRKLEQNNGIPVARIDGRACGSCFMELDVGTLHDFDALAADEVSSCPECGAMLVRPATLAVAMKS